MRGHPRAKRTHTNPAACSASQGGTKSRNPPVPAACRGEIRGQRGHLQLSIELAANPLMFRRLIATKGHQCHSVQVIDLTEISAVTIGLWASTRLRLKSQTNNPERGGPRGFHWGWGLSRARDVQITQAWDYQRGPVYFCLGRSWRERVATPPLYHGMWDDRTLFPREVAMISI